MNIPDALHELADQLGLPNLEIEGSGFVMIEFDDLEVSFETTSDENALRLSAIVCPSATGHETLERLLHANLLGLATGGAHFSLDEAGENIQMERTLDVGSMDFTSFSNAVETFINQLEGWRDDLSQAAATPPRSDSPTSCIPSTGMMRV
jgi:hypothetical protein